MSDKPRSDWLSRALARAGVLPLVEAESAIRSGRVRLNGRAVSQPLTPYRSGDRVELDGRRVALESTTRVVMFHKPAGVVTGPDGTDMLLRSALPPELGAFQWYSVGRLDKDTTGLLLYTNDPRFVEHATSPGSKLRKTYRARVYGKITEAKLQKLRDGIELDDGVARGRLKQLGDDEIELSISEGRFHQVKRMLGAVGLPVHTLHRVAIGKLTLDVVEGAMRALSDDEIGQSLGFAKDEA